MDEFGKRAAADRAPFFIRAAEKLNMSPQIVEKDFWVCWTLGRLFSLPEVGPTLVFKGGTSLSKVYGVIERFSEDVDLSVDKTVLGFTGAKEPEKASSSNQQQKLIEQLAKTCLEFVQTRLVKTLQKDFASRLAKADAWSLEIDPLDPDGQTLLFRYPSSVKGQGYINEFVKIEMGARSDHWPIHVNEVHSYLADVLPGVLKQPSANVKVLNAARTFWEKATILHMYANLPHGKKIALRQSRHYYDFYRLLLSKHKNEALVDLPLLKRVAEHKRIYFRAAWAKYEEAAPGTLKLMPDDRVLTEMKRDYSQMKEMFFGIQPDWQDVIAGIDRFQKEFNRR